MDKLLEIIGVEEFIAAVIGMATAMLTQIKSAFPKLIDVFLQKYFDKKITSKEDLLYHRYFGAAVNFIDKFSGFFPVRNFKYKILNPLFKYYVLEKLNNTHSSFSEVVRKNNFDKMPQLEFTHLIKGIIMDADSKTELNSKNYFVTVFKLEENDAIALLELFNKFQKNSIINTKNIILEYCMLDRKSNYEKMELVLNEKYSRLMLLCNNITDAVEMLEKDDKLKFMEKYG